MRSKSIVIALGVLLAFLAASIWFHKPVAAALPGGGGPFSNQPIALSWDDSLLAVCNPDGVTVSIFQVSGDTNTKIAEPVAGKAPAGVAWSPDGTRLYVAVQGDGVVAVIARAAQYAGGWGVVNTIPVGVEPHGMVLSASGRKLYVTNTRSNNVSVIDITTNQVTATISGVGPEPRGIALTHGASITDTNQIVLVTDFLALPSGNGHPDGFDDAKAGFVTAISVANDAVLGTIKVLPIADTGFKAAGDALARIAPPPTPVASDFTFTTGAYPNQLNNLAIHGNFAYLPNTAASPNGPVRFNVNEQSLVSVINVLTRQDTGQTINIQSAVGAQANPAKLFVTQPWAIAFKNSADTAYVVSAASNVVVKLAVDPASGKPTVQNDPSDTTRVLEIPVGKNPRGIVISSTDTRAYVWNYVSRDVSVIDLTQSPEKVVATLVLAAQPQPGTIEDKYHIGKELFFTSVGSFDPSAPGQPAITGRMSNNGWGLCGTCHPNGLTDNVVWIFASGPRRTVSMHTTFAAADPTQQRALNWSAIFDEVEDFEGNIRNVSGGLGLFVQADGVTPAPLLGALAAPSGGQKQLTVRGVGGWDAIKEYVARGIPAPLAPLPKIDPDVIAGRQLFIQANCQNCHGTAAWTTSRIRFTPPPDASLIQNAQLIGQLRKVGTFDPAAINEIRATAVAPLGADGFNPPSLLSISAFPQTFFHGGSANSLDEVLNNVTHRTAGTGGTDTLSQAGARAQLVKFLLSIDATTVPIAPNAAAVPTRFAVSAPSLATAGAPFSVTVTALDANDFVVTAYSGKVHFTSSDPGATLPPDATLSQGVGTFQVTLASGPSRTITAADSVNTSISGTSNAITVNPTVLSVSGASPGAGAGNSQTFTFSFFDPLGTQDLSVVNVLINNFLDGRNACYLAYSVSSNTLLLVDDGGNAGGPFAGTVAVGSSATIQNSQCSVNLVSATSIGGTLALTLNVTFKPAFGGNRIAFMAARDQRTGNTGWQALGTWQVPFTPGVISVSNLTPGRGTSTVGTPQTLSFTVTDTKGAGDIGVVNLLMNNFIDGRSACYLAYAASSNTLFLVNDTGDGGGPFAGGLLLNGSGGSIQNSQCSISGTGTSVTTSGNTMTVNFNVTFKAAFAGNRIVYVAGRDRADGNNTDWQALGTVTVK